ncbi:MAG: hypothetical protein R2701_06160 [Acidimicrobiales bacterium]
MTESRAIRRRALWAVVVTLVLIGLLVSSADNRRVSGDPGPTGIQKVVVLGIPALSLDDLDTGVMPNLDRGRSRAPSRRRTWGSAPTHRT